LPAEVYVYEHRAKNASTQHGSLRTDVTIKELAETIQAVVGYSGQIVFDVTKPTLPTQSACQPCYHTCVSRCATRKKM
jgi:hypothetical protein